MQIMLISHLFPKASDRPVFLAVNDLGDVLQLPVGPIDFPRAGEVLRWIRIDSSIVGDFHDWTVLG